MSAEPTYFYLFYRTDVSNQRDYNKVCAPVLEALSKSPARNYFSTICAKDPKTRKTSPYVHAYGIRKIPTIVTDTEHYVGPEECLAFIHDINMNSVRNEQADPATTAVAQEKPSMKPVLDLPQYGEVEDSGAAFVCKGNPIDFGAISKSEGVDVATTMSIAEKIEAIKKAHKNSVGNRPKFGPPKTFGKDA